MATSPTLRSYQLLLVLIAAITTVGATLSTNVQKIDDAVLDFFVQQRTASLTTIITAITRLADTAPVIILVTISSLYLSINVSIRYGAFLVFSSTGSWLTTLALKYILDRERPAIPLRLYEAATPAFPSGHATQATGFYLALAFLLVFTLHKKKYKILALSSGTITAGLIGFSRIYLGAHWLSDVVAGLTIGLLWIALLLPILPLTKLQKPENVGLRQTPTVG